MTPPLSGTERGTGGEDSRRETGPGGEDPDSDLPTSLWRERRETAAVPEVEREGERDQRAHCDPADNATGGQDV